MKKKKVKKMLISKDRTLLFLYNKFGTARLREISREESTTLGEAGATDLVFDTHNDKATFYQSDSAGSIISNKNLSAGNVARSVHRLG